MNIEVGSAIDAKDVFEVHTVVPINPKVINLNGILYIKDIPELLQSKD